MDLSKIYLDLIDRENRKNKNTDINDNFYINTIAPAFLKSKLDNYLEKLKSIKYLSAEKIPQIL